MIKNFLEFMKESQSQDQSQGQSQDSGKVPTLHIINDIEYNNPETQWFMTIDIKDIWDKYKAKSINFEEFTKQYNEKLLGQKSELEKIGKECYNDLVEVTKQVGEYNEEKSNRYFNRIYDWGDEHGVKIVTGGQTEQTQTQEPQTQEPQTQNNNTIQ